MELIFRSGRIEDATDSGTICYLAFKTIAEEYNFTPDFPNPDSAIALFQYMLSANDIYSVIVESDGTVIGSNFLWEGDDIAGVGPITVDPRLQNISVGRKLMERVLQRADEQNYAGVRLVQAAYHNRSLSLYTKLGFEAREPLSVMQGPALNLSVPAYRVRKAEEKDVLACKQLCIRVHGHHRSKELINATKAGTALVVEYEGTITAYTTGIGFFGHTVALSNNEMKALIGASEHFPGPGFLLPTRNTELFRWCLAQGLRVVQPMTLMSRGLYNEPKGAFLPSVLY